MQKIMVIEDDTAIQEELALLLENEGYTPLVVTNFTDIPGQAVLERPDLILLDIGLPGRDGFSLCAALRKAVSAPVIFVTSRDASTDEVRALSLGGDDYITKPYSVPVLLARIKAVLRRSKGDSEAASDDKKTVVYDKLEINIVNYELKVNGEAIDTPPKELELIYHFASNPNRVYTRDQLLDEVWGFDYYGDSRTVDVHVKRLREKLEGVSDKWTLKTVWGVGYKFETKE